MKIKKNYFLSTVASMFVLGNAPYFFTRFLEYLSKSARQTENLQEHQMFQMRLNPKQAKKVLRLWFAWLEFESYVQV